MIYLSWFDIRHQSDRITTFVCIDLPCWKIRFILIVLFHVLRKRAQPKHIKSTIATQLRFINTKISFSHPHRKLQNCLLTLKFKFKCETKEVEKFFFREQYRNHGERNFSSFISITLISSVTSFLIFNNNGDVLVDMLCDDQIGSLRSLCLKFVYHSHIYGRPV